MAKNVPTIQPSKPSKSQGAVSSTGSAAVLTPPAADVTVTAPAMPADAPTATAQPAEVVVPAPAPAADAPAVATAPAPQGAPVSFAALLAAAQSPAPAVAPAPTVSLPSDPEALAKFALTDPAGFAAAVAALRAPAVTTAVAPAPAVPDLNRQAQTVLASLALYGTSGCTHPMTVWHMTAPGGALSGRYGEALRTLVRMGYATEGASRGAVKVRCITGKGENYLADLRAAGRAPVIPNPAPYSAPVQPVAAAPTAPTGIAPLADLLSMPGAAALVADPVVWRFVRDYTDGCLAIARTHGADALLACVRHELSKVSAPAPAGN